jgi:hypothetical protein
MVKDHEKDLAEFQKEANEATDADLKEFAETTAKMVQKHLDLARETQSKLQEVLAVGTRRACYGAPRSFLIARDSGVDAQSHFDDPVPGARRDRWQI